MTTSPIWSRTKQAADLFERIDRITRNSNLTPVQVNGVSIPSILDGLGRFKIWAGNIGAFQGLEMKSSLDFRLRNAPKISYQIVDILDELIESLEDACSILSNERVNRTGLAIETTLSEDNRNSSIEVESDTVNGAGTESDNENGREELSEIREIFKAIEESINSLFRFSIIIRNNTNRDRYAKATAAALISPFSSDYDCMHVRHKFPALENGKEWLIDRLGKAITMRRQYLRYCKEHHSKTARDPEAVVKFPSVPQVVSSKFLFPHGQTRTIGALSNFSNPTSTQAPTQASTLILSAAQTLVEEEDVDEVQSQTSYATSYDEDNSNTKLHVVPLEDVSKGLKHFECPYCWQIVAVATQKAWKKHVLSDLKPYTCGYEECELKLFPDRHTWFSHELKDHRREWQCYFCSRQPFSAVTKYQQHLTNRHSHSFAENQLPALIKMSQRAAVKIPASDCQFCDDWELRLREINPHILLSEELVVTPSQFRHHVGGHMEQLALFAIPRGYTENGNADSNAAHSNGSAHRLDPKKASSIHDSLPDSDSAKALRVCEDIVTEMINACHALSDQHWSEEKLQDISLNLQCGNFTSADQFRSRLHELMLEFRRVGLDKTTRELLRIVESFWDDQLSESEESVAASSEINMPLDEDAVRKTLTTYKAFTLRKATPESPSQPSTWAVAYVTEEAWGQDDIVEQLSRLNSKDVSVTEKKEALESNMQIQVNALLDRLKNEDLLDPHFETLLVQLDSKTHTLKAGIKEATTLTVYVRRAPKPNTNVILMYEARELQKKQITRALPPQSPVRQVCVPENATVNLSIAEVAPDQTGLEGVVTGFQKFNGSSSTIPDDIERQENEQLKEDHMIPSDQRTKKENADDARTTGPTLAEKVSSDFFIDRNIALEAALQRELKFYEGGKTMLDAIRDGEEDNKSSKVKRKSDQQLRVEAELETSNQRISALRSALMHQDTSQPSGLPLVLATDPSEGGNVVGDNTPAKLAVGPTRRRLSKLFSFSTLLGASNRDRSDDSNSKKGKVIDPKSGKGTPPIQETSPVQGSNSGSEYSAEDSTNDISRRELWPPATADTLEKRKFPTLRRGDSKPYNA